jgi:hypothetical protein
MNRRGNIKLSASGVWAGATGKGARMKVRAPNRVSHTYRQRLNGSVSKVFPLKDRSYVGSRRLPSGGFLNR